MSIYTDEDFIPKITIDVPIPIGYVTEHLIELSVGTILERKAFVY